MRLTRTAALVTLTGALLLPACGISQTSSQTAQERHDRAEQAQTEKDHRHHTGAKVVGGSTAGGAAIGALAGGGKGALIGGAVGAVGGAVGNKVRKDKAVNKGERREN